MSFRFYRTAFFVTLSVGLVALLALLGCLLIWPTMPRPTTRVLFASSMLLIGLASLLSVSCGFQHRKMWVKGGLRSYAREEKATFAVDITAFAGLGVLLVVVSLMMWTVE
jgi:hypothetical protein